MSRTEKLAYRFINAVLKVALRSPLHALFSEDVMLVTVTGRKSCKPYTVPLSYACDGGCTIVCFTSDRWSKWWRNLRGGAPVTAHVRGRKLKGTATAITGDCELLVRELQTFLWRFPARPGVMA